MTDSTTVTDCDIAIIGGGPGGYVAAIRAAQAGLKTILIEAADALGGICLNRGCIPTKSLLRSAEAYDLARQGAEYGFTAEEVAPDFDRIMTRARTVPLSLSQGVAQLMKKYGITVLHGRATLTGGTRVAVDGHEACMIEAINIIIATGAHPSPIPSVTPDHRRVLTSDDLLDIENCPSSILIIGAGAIGVQFASFFNAFGASVVLTDIADHILPFVDSEVSRRLAFSFRKRGIDIKTGATIESLQVSDGGCHATFSNGTSIDTEIVLISAGYTGNVAGIGLETAGIAIERGYIHVDNSFCTTAPHIYAIGDVIGPPMLAHAASMEGELAVEAILGHPAERLDPELVPIALYSHPQVASVGITEDDAREKGIDIIIGTCPFRVIGKAVAVGETEGFTKVIIDRASHRFLGAHIIGSDADETIQEVVLAMNTGITADQLLGTMHSHPTLAESVREATASALGRPLNT